MTSRRSFLTRSGLALGALIVGDQALEAFARLTHVRKSFPSAGITLRSGVTYPSRDLVRRMIEAQRRAGLRVNARWVELGQHITFGSVPRGTV